jgi:hypothetical protein
MGSFRISAAISWRLYVYLSSLSSLIRLISDLIRGHINININIIIIIIIIIKLSEFYFLNMKLQKFNISMNAVFWDVTPCGSCKNRRFGATYQIHHQGNKKW